MYLEKNNFTGTLPEIPDTVGVAPDLHRSSLRVLWLEHNKGLHGTVPPSWQRLSLLQALVAAHCSFNSTVGGVLAPLVAKDRAYVPAQNHSITPTYSLTHTRDALFLLQLLPQFAAAAIPRLCRCTLQLCGAARAGL